MKSRYVAGLLDACASITMGKDNAVRVRLSVGSRALYDHLTEVIGAEDTFARVVIARHETRRFPPKPKKKKNDDPAATAETEDARDVSPPCLASPCLATALTRRARYLPQAIVTVGHTFTVDLETEQAAKLLALLADKGVLLRDSARAAVAGDEALLAAANKRLDASPRPDKKNPTKDLTPVTPLDIDGDALTPAWLAGYFDAAGAGVVSRNKSTVRVDFPKTPTGAALMDKIMGSKISAAEPTLLQYAIVFHGAAAEAAGTLLADSCLLTEAFRDAAEPAPAPKPRAAAPKKRDAGEDPAAKARAKKAKKNADEDAEEDADEEI